MMILPFFLASANVTVPLALPSLAVAVASENTNDDSITTGSFKPANGYYQVIIVVSRDGSSTAHGTPAPSGFTYETTPTQRATIENTGVGTLIRTTFWTARVATSASGTLTHTAAGALFQHTLIVLKVPGASAFDTFASGALLLGTTLDAVWDATPNAAAEGIVAVGQDSATGSWTCSAGMDLVASASGTVGSLRWEVRAKLLSLPSPVAFAGMANDFNKAAAGVSIT
jgi:hypothetical protein